MIESTLHPGAPPRPAGAGEPEVENHDGESRKSPELLGERTSGAAKIGGATEGAPELPGKIGEPWRSRTSNLLIKSQLLCQLS